MTDINGIGDPGSGAYTDLTLYDVSESDLVDRALLDAQVKLPDWEPREGNTEVVLLEALALLVGPLIYSVNRLPLTTLEGLLTLYGMQRSEGARAEGTLALQLGDLTGGHVIPAGTRFAVSLATGETVEVEAIADTAPSVPNLPALLLPVRAVEPGAALNGVEVTTEFEILDPIAAVDYAAVASGGFTGGADPEDDDAFFARGTRMLQRLSSTLVLVDQFEDAALDFAAVGRAKVVDRAKPGTVEAVNGSITVYVTDHAGAALPAATRTQIADSLNDRSFSLLTVYVETPTVTTVNVVAQIEPQRGYDGAEVAARAEAALEAWMSPTGWPWLTTVRRNDIIGVLSRVEGVNSVRSLTQPASDVSLVGPSYSKAPLVNGAVTVTVAQ